MGSLLPRLVAVAALAGLPALVQPAVAQTPAARPQPADDVAALERLVPQAQALADRIRSLAFAGDVSGARAAWSAGLSLRAEMSAAMRRLAGAQGAGRNAGDVQARIARLMGSATSLETLLSSLGEPGSLEQEARRGAIWRAPRAEVAKAVGEMEARRAAFDRALGALEAQLGGDSWREATRASSQMALALRQMDQLRLLYRYAVLAAPASDVAAVWEAERRLEEIFWEASGRAQEIRRRSGMQTLAASRRTLPLPAEVVAADRRLAEALQPLLAQATSAAAGFRGHLAEATLANARGNVEQARREWQAAEARLRVLGDLEARAESLRGQQAGLPQERRQMQRLESGLLLEEIEASRRLAVQENLHAREMSQRALAFRNAVGQASAAPVQPPSPTATPGASPTLAPALSRPAPVRPSAPAGPAVLPPLPPLPSVLPAAPSLGETPPRAEMERAPAHWAGVAVFRMGQQRDWLLTLAEMGQDILSHAERRALPRADLERLGEIQARLREGLRRLEEQRDAHRPLAAAAQGSERERTLLALEVLSEAVMAVQQSRDDLENRLYGVMMARLRQDPSRTDLDDLAKEERLVRDLRALLQDARRSLERLRAETDQVRLRVRDGDAEGALRHVEAARREFQAVSEAVDARLVPLTIGGPSFESSLRRPQQSPDLIRHLFMVKAQAEGEMRAAAEAAGVPVQARQDMPGRP